MVSIPACHAGDPGSIPGLGVFVFCLLSFLSFWPGLSYPHALQHASAVLAERLRRTLKARVRKSVGSIPTDCTFFVPKPMKQKAKNKMWRSRVSIPVPHAC